MFLHSSRLATTIIGPTRINNICDHKVVAIVKSVRGGGGGGTSQSNNCGLIWLIGCNVSRQAKDIRAPTLRYEI